MPSWGIFQDPKYPNVPGTVQLTVQVSDEKIQCWEYQEPKKRGDIVLNPQPSESPNDPLNWSITTKITILLILSLNAGVTVSLGPMITTDFKNVAKEFKVTTDQVASSVVGLMQLTMGLGTPFTAAAAAVWGKRPVLIISALALLGTSAWGFFAGSLVSLSLMRVLQGVAAAPLETLVSATVSDLFFVHEKGRMLSIWNMFVMGGVKLGQLIAGFIIHHLGFKSTFGICALIYAVIIPMLYFFVPETVFFLKDPETKVVFDKSSLAVYEIVLPEPKKTHRERLQLFQGRVSHAGFWSTSFDSLPLLSFPAVSYVSLTYAVYAFGMTLIAIVQNTIFSAPPYNLNASAIELATLPLFGVGLVGTLIAGYFADSVVQYMARKNNGVYEPEFRLVLMIVAASFNTFAYVGFGYSIAAGAPLYVPIAFLGVQTFAVSFAMSSMFTYIMDCHASHAAQAFVTMSFVKGVLTLVMSNFVNGWFQQAGPTTVFNVVAAVNLAVSALSLPMYFYGKMIRSKIARSPFHQKF